VKLLYFAWLRSRIGHAEEQTTLPEHVRDVAGLLDWLRGRGPAYAEALRDLSVVRVAVNQRAHKMVGKAQRQLERTVPLARRVVAQTQARIFQGNPLSREAFQSV